MFEKHFLRQ